MEDFPTPATLRVAMRAWQSLEKGLSRRRGLPLITRLMRAIKYLGRLLREFFEFAWHNKAWWIIPIVLVLLLLGFIVVSGSSVAPFIYTLF